jgi:hypothetical protein
VTSSSTTTLALALKRIQQGKTIYRDDAARCGKKARQRTELVPDPSDSFK